METVDLGFNLRSIRKVHFVSPFLLQLSHTECGAEFRRGPISQNSV